MDVRIQLAGRTELTVYEVHGTSQDQRDWLSQAIKFASKDWPNFLQYVLNGFSPSSRCAILGCERLVEVGARLTFDGKSILIVPCCADHNEEGRIDNLGRQARLKPYQVYLEILEREFVSQDADGKFNLAQPLPGIVDD